MEVCSDRRLVYLWGLLLDESMPKVRLKKKEEREEGDPMLLMKY
jgi:hypothetical protein